MTFELRMDADGKKYFCGHCNAPISKTLFFKHKRLFYDPHLKVWKNKRIPPSVDVEDEFFLSKEAAHVTDQDCSGCGYSGENEEYNLGKFQSKY